MVAALAFVLAPFVAAPTANLAPAELDAAGLSRVLAAKNGQAVVALTDGRTVAADESGTLDAIGAELKLRNVRLTPGLVAVASPEILPDAAMRSVSRLRKPDSTRKSDAIDLPKTVVAGGKVTYASEAGKTIKLASLVSVPWSLPLRLSPAYLNVLSETNLAVNVKDLDEAEFLRAVAKAIGGRYRTDSKALYIEASGGELRSRALRTIDLTLRNPRDKAENNMNLSAAQVEGSGESDEVAVAIAVSPSQGRGGRRSPNAPVATNAATLPAQLDLARAVTSGILPRDFEALMNGDLPSVTLNLAGQTAAQNALIRLLRANASAPPEAERVNRLLASVPPRQPGEIVLGEGYSIDATLNTVDRRGNLGRTVRLKAL